MIDYVVKDTDILRALMDKTDDRIYFKDINSPFITLNKATAMLLGNLAEAFKVAQKIRKKIEEIKWDKKDLVITVSGGVAQYIEKGTEELIIKADELLYSAKANGRNRIEKEN